MSSETQALSTTRRPFKAIRRELIEEFERRYVYRLLEQHDFNVSAVARSSGLSRRHLYSLIRKHGFHEHIPGMQWTADIAVEP